MKLTNINRMKRILTIATLLFTFWSLNAQQPCVIGSFSYELVRENNQQFYFKISKPTDLPQNYTVFINNNKYEAPQIIDGGAFYYGPFPIDCNVNYTLKIQNKSNESCNISASIGKVCSEIPLCGFSNIRHEVISCNDLKLKLWLNFQPQNTNNLGFDLFNANGNLIGFYKYSDLPITIEYERQVGEYQLLYIQDNDNPNCVSKYEFKVDCIPNEECKIYDITYSVPECNPNGVVYVALDFKYANVKSEKFIVKGNGIHYGTFAYQDLPIKVGPIVPQCDKKYEFGIADAENPNCSNYIEDIMICCPTTCQLPKFEIDNMECSDAVIGIKLKLITDSPISNFKILFNNTTVPNYKLDYPYIYFEIQNNLTSIYNKITICNSDPISSDCCYTKEINLANCIPNGDCKIGDLIISNIECGTNGLAYLSLDFKHENVASDYFTVQGNGKEYGKFKYADLPIRLGQIEANCDKLFEFVVKDSVNPDCANKVGNIQLCCPTSCQLPKFEIVNIECSNTLISVKLKLINDIQINNFKILFNNTTIANYKLDFPYIYFELSNNLTSIHNKITLCSYAPNGSDCCYTQEFSLENCVPNGECKIGELILSQSECSADGLVYMKLDFKHENEASDYFTVHGNGKEYGKFKYSELPISIGPLEANCEKSFEFVVKDSVKPDCANKIGNILICCPSTCPLPKFEIVNIECNDAELSVKLKLTNDSQNTNFKILFNNTTVANYELVYPYIYFKYPNILTSAHNKITLCAVTVTTVECCFSQEFTLENCLPNGECRIGELKVSNIECKDDGSAFLTLDFKHENELSNFFTVHGNGKDYGTFEYDDLPIRLGPIDANCEKSYEFIVKDTENPQCASDIGNVKICCNDHCQEPKFEIINVECGDAHVFMKLKFSAPIINDDLLIIVNNSIINEYKIDGQFLYLSFLNNSIGIVNNITICTIPTTNLSCCYTKSFTLENCNPSGDCKIGTIKIQPSECNDSGEIPYVLLNFEYTNVGDKGFTVKGNGHNYGVFNYEDLPVRLQIGSNCDINYEFVIIDNENESCKGVIEYGKICCEEACTFKPKEIRTQCSDGILREVAFYLNEVTDPIKSYKVYINDVFIAEINENNIFHEIETQIPIYANHEYALIICDDNCCVKTRLDVSGCAILDECSIENITTTQISCSSAGLQFVLDFEYFGNGSEKFELFSSKGLFKSYYYNELPLKIENFPNSSTGNNLLFICDMESICCAGHEFRSGDCSPFHKETDDVWEKTNNFIFIKQNPVTTNLYLTSPYTNTSYKIFDSDGNQVQVYDSENHEEIIDISYLKSGLYFVQIRTKDSVKIEKLIIAK